MFPSSGSRKGSFNSVPAQPVGGDESSVESVRAPLLHSSSAVVSSSKNELRHSIWRMHRRMVAGNLVLSTLLLFAVSIIVYSNLKDASLFSFGWSNRIININEPREFIASLYRENTDTSDARMDEMLRLSLEAAMCRQVAHNGGAVLQWKQDEVSPTCNCLRNTHVEYVKSVQPYGVHLDVATMNRSDSVLNKLWISNRIRVECFQNIRHTQVYLWTM